MTHATVFDLAWPIMISMLSYTAMTVADTIYVGQLGTAELAAIGLAASAIHLGLAFGNGLLGGVRIEVARAMGRKDLDRVSQLAVQGLWLAGFFGVLTACLAPLGPVLFSAMGASQEVGALATQYFGIRTLGAPICLLWMALSCWFLGRGDSRTTMKATVVGNVLNIVLDPLFIFGLGPVEGLGLAGAALASMVGLSVGAVYMGLVAWRQLRPVSVWPCARLVRDIVVVGGPLGTQYFLDVASFAGFSALLAWSGDVHLAAHVVVVRIILLSFLPCHALGEAAGVLVGQSLGAGSPDRAVDALRLGTYQAVAIMVVFGVLFLLVPDSLTGIFGADDDVRRIARDILILYATVQVVDAVGAVTLGALSGAGDTRFVMVLNVAAAWLVKLPVGCALVLGLGLGALGAWIGVACEIMVVTAMALWRVRGSAWLSHPIS